ncbi:hypothetical protein [Streptomyces sp. NBC_01431]|nr:hypothetical protein [Streptomyces sp. NBC_01431]
MAMYITNHSTNNSALVGSSRHGENKFLRRPLLGIARLHNLALTG